VLAGALRYRHAGLGPHGLTVNSLDSLQGLASSNSEMAYKVGYFFTLSEQDAEKLSISLSRTALQMHAKS